MRGFYKAATESMDKLAFPLDVTFLGENGIDESWIVFKDFSASQTGKVLRWRIQTLVSYS